MKEWKGIGNIKMENDVLLSARGLGKTFYTAKGTSEALSDVSLDIMRGEIFGLVGESGSGKSTLGRTLIGIYEPTGGEVYYLGEKIRVGTEEHINRIKALKARGRVEFLRFLKSLVVDHRSYKEKKKDYENVNNNLKNELKSAREALRRARAAQTGVRCSEIQMIFQDPSASLNPRMTVGESVREGLIAAGMKNSEEIEKRVDDALYAVGLSPKDKSRYPHEFSGGQRQRIGIARAVIMRPRLLIADEPVSALDVSVQAQVINLLEDLARELSLSVLFIAHDLAVVRHISDRIGVMYKGRLVELGKTEDIFNSPCHPYTRSLLSAMPLADPYLEAQRKRCVYTVSERCDEESFVEIGDGHFVLASREDAEKYKRGIFEGDDR